MTDFHSLQTESAEMPMASIPASHIDDKTFCSSIDNRTVATEAQLYGHNDSDIGCIIFEMFGQFADSFCGNDSSTTVDSRSDEDGYTPHRDDRVRESLYVNESKDREASLRRREVENISPQTPQISPVRTRSVEEVATPAVKTRGKTSLNKQAAPLDRDNRSFQTSRSRSRNSSRSRSRSRSSDAKSIVTYNSQKSSVTHNSKKSSESSANSYHSRRAMKPRNGNDASPTVTSHRKRSAAQSMSKSKSNDNRNRIKLLPRKPSFRRSRSTASKKEMDIIPEQTINDVQLSQELKAEILQSIEEAVRTASLESQATDTSSRDIHIGKIINQTTKKAVADVSENFQDAFMDPEFYQEVRAEAGYLVGMLMGSGRGMVDNYFPEEDHGFLEDDGY